MSEIFHGSGTLRPSSMATVAERRFDDAEALCATNLNARANGAAYMVGFVVEILLKARLVTKFQSIANKRQHDVKSSESMVWRLIWRTHDLEAMLLHLHELENSLISKGLRDGVDYYAMLKSVCTTWTIQARYSAKSMQMDEAKDLVERVRVLKELLK